MKKNVVYFLAIGLLGLAACKSSKQAGNAVEFKSPESGTEIKAGTVLSLELNLKDTEGIDSIVYLLDEQKLAVLKAGETYSLSTDSLKTGNRLLTARVYRGSEMQEGSASVLIMPAKAPVKWKYQVEATFPHDTSSYTQGLEFHAGVFYESDGEYGSSSLRKVAPKTGEVLKKIALDSQFFGEGLTVWGSKVIQLTWQENRGLVYDKESLSKLAEFPYQNSREGWGLCNDGKRLYKSDGTNMIYFLNPETYQEEGFIEVYDAKGPVDQLNELELIEGKIFANVYQSRRVVVIDPKTGAVTAEIDLSGLRVSNSTADVLNGIAYDAASGRIWVTGKKWDKLFQIKLLR